MASHPAISDHPCAAARRALFRGALVRIVVDWLGSWLSLAVSSFVFGFAHLANPAGTVLGAICISIEAGVLFAAAYMLTRRLWLSSAST